MDQIVTKHPRTLRRALAIAIAGATLGVTGAAAVDASNQPAIVACRSNESDLLRAAYEARKLEALRPELFEDGLRSTYADLRVAAEWARRLEAQRPELVC